MTNHKALSHIWEQLKQAIGRVESEQNRQELEGILVLLGLLVADYANARDAQRADYLVLKLFIESEIEMRKQVRSWSDATRTAKLATANSAMKALEHLIPWQWTDAPAAVQRGLFDQTTPDYATPDQTTKGPIT